MIYRVIRVNDSTVLRHAERFSHSRLGKIKDEIRGGSGYSMLEPRSARESALEWLNGKVISK